MSQDIQINPKKPKMNTHPVELTLEIRSADGTSTEFLQADEERIRKALRLLAAPRLFTQPQLVLASDRGATTIPCRAIDVILARTSAPIPITIPLQSPAGSLDIRELCDYPPNGNPSPTDARQDCHPPASGNPVTFQVQLHTHGGWVTTLKVVPMTPSTVQDHRQVLAHLFDLPAIPFRLEAGGMGLINPANLTRVSASPAPDALPETALPMDLVRWTPLFQGTGKPTSPMRIDLTATH